ncbi:DUF2845 domain-containing protein [Pseudaeromonas sharmana]|uniref:DUF2845 domain-containing protein n=1 Tax=Pseudaeromonas sharmana TaxID=328412 RepID=A0ABV8CJE5_9GAMM
MTPKYWLFLALAASAAQADALRCGNALIATGDSQSELVAKCGSPLDREDKLETRTDNDGNQQTVKIGEILTIDMGKGQFMQRVTVVNGLITAIENGARHD